MIKKSILIALVILPVISMLPVLKSNSEGGVIPPDPNSSELSKARIVFDESVYDFGKQTGESELKHSFTFKNMGSSVLVIESVKASCGCTAAISSAKEIPSGEKGTIDVAFKPGKMLGDVSKTITVKSNDPQNPSTTLTIKATMETWLSCKPDRVYFGQIQRNEKKDQIIELMGKELAGIKIIDVSLTKSSGLQEDTKLKQEVATNASISEGITWKIEDKRHQEEKTLKLIVSVDSSKLKPGQFSQELTVTTDSKNAPKLGLALSGEILGPIAVVPRRIYFRDPDSEKENIQQVTLKSEENSKFKILHATSSDPVLTIKNLDSDSSSMHSFEIVLANNISNERIQGNITVETDNPDQPLITIPVYAYRQQHRSPRTPVDTGTSNTQFSSRPSSSDQKK